MSLRLLHFSDPHFSLITSHPKQFLSKQWLGNLNLILFRRKKYKTAHLFDLPSLADELHVDYVVATGDFTSTSRLSEFKLAQVLMAQFNQPILTVPGNHDVYTKKTEKNKLYYQYFPASQLESTGIEIRQLNDTWWWIGLDCAKANPLWRSNGIFRKQMEPYLEQALSQLPPNSFAIIGNHFPLYPGRHPSHDTKRCAQLQEILKTYYPKVKLYLHGHEHTPYIIDKQMQHLPVSINAGSIAYSPGGIFYLIDLTSDACQIKQYVNAEGWRLDKTIQISWDCGS